MEIVDYSGVSKTQHAINKVKSSKKMSVYRDDAYQTYESNDGGYSKQELKEELEQ